MSDRSCERCSTPLEDGDLRCCICGMCAPAVERAAVAVEALRIVRCKECGAAVSYRVEKRAPVCRFCGAETRVEEPTDPVEQPSEYLEFKVEREEAVSAMRSYLASLGWFRPADLARGATVDSLTPLYFAAWAFEAEADVTWAADSDAGSRRSDWAPHAGRTHLRWRNVLVSASRGLRQKEVQLLATGYDLANARAISDDIADEVEQFDVQRSAARATVLSAVNALAVADIEREHVPGSRARNVHVSALLERLVTRRVALPCFVFVYRYDGRPYRCIVHGRDARIALGSAPLSWARIAFVVILAALAILVAITIASR